MGTLLLTIATICAINSGNQYVSYDETLKQRKECIKEYVECLDKQSGFIDYRLKDCMKSLKK